MELFHRHCTQVRLLTVIYPDSFISRQGMHGIQVIDQRFHRLKHFIFIDPFHEGGHIPVKIGKTLPAKHIVLGRLQDNRRQCGSGAGTFRRTNISMAIVETFGQQPAQRNLNTIECLAIKIKVMNVHITAHMRQRHVFGNHSGQIISFARGARNLQHFGGRRIGNIGIVSAGLHQDILYRIHQFRFAFPDSASL